MGIGGEIVPGHGWLWVLEVKLWFVVVDVGSASEIMAGRGWSWIVAVKFWLLIVGYGWSHDFVMSNTI